MNIDPRTAAAEELLQALTVGDVSADDPAVVARLAADADLRARWQALAATLAGLRELDAGTHERGAAEPHVDTHAAVRAFRRRGTRRWWLAAAGLAAALLVVPWLCSEPGRQAPDPTLGSGDRITGLAPDGFHVDWPAGEPFRWSPLRNAAGYRLEVRPATGAALVVLPNGPRGEWIASNSWSPTTEQRAALPAQFEWRVIAYDASNDSIATSAWATTRR